jgi:hypothetical protein
MVCFASAAICDPLEVEPAEQPASVSDATAAAATNAVVFENFIVSPGWALRIRLANEWMVRK